MGNFIFSGVFGGVYVYHAINSILFMYKLYYGSILQKMIEII